MGDRSPKSKQRDQHQKDAAKVQSAAQTKTKQAAYSATSGIGSKGKK